MNKYVLFIISCLLVVIILNAFYINRIPNNVEILQANNPNKETLEKIIIQKFPSIFTNVTKNIDLNKINTDIINKQISLKSDVYSYFSYYLTPMCLTHGYNIEINQQINLKRVSTHRFLICQFSGKSKIYLFSPNQSKFLYPIKSKKGLISKVNFWKPEEQ